MIDDIRFDEAEQLSDEALDETKPSLITASVPCAVCQKQ